MAGKPVRVAGTTFPSFAAAARHFAVDRWLAKRRYRNLGWSLDEAFGVTPRERRWEPRRVQVAGVEYASVAAVALAYGIDCCLVQSRLARGRTIEGALELPGADFEPHRKVIVAGGVAYESIAAACRAHRISPQHYNSRRRHGWTSEQALGLEDPPRGKVRCLGLVYKVTHVESGKAYVGLTRASISARWAGHVAAALKKKTCPSGSLQEAIRAAGQDAFQVEELARAATIGELVKLECDFIKKFGTLAPAGFNLNAGGAGIHAQGKPVTVRGTKYPSIAEACRNLGVSADVVRLRLKKGVSPDEAFALPVRPATKPLVFEGRYFTTEKALAQAYGVKYTVFRGRRFKGQTLEQALGIDPPPLKRTAITLHGKVYENLKLAAEHVGVPYNTVIMRRAKGCTLEEAFSTEHFTNRGGLKMRTASDGTPTLSSSSEAGGR